MRKQNRRLPVRDTMLLSGWLFADLLLGLTIIFFAAVPGTKTLPPTLIVSPTELDPNNAACIGGLSAPRCTVTVSETASSQGLMNWSVSSDMSDNVTFSPANGTLAPGKSLSVTISTFPCQNGSFTFSGSREARPVMLKWRCTLPPVMPERLDFSYKRFQLTINDVNGLLNDSPQAIDNIKQQVRNQPLLANRSVGLAVVYGGTPDDAGIGQAQQIATKIYAILGALGREGFSPLQRTSYYDPLYTLGNSANIVQVDIYRFQ